MERQSNSQNKGIEIAITTAFLLTELIIYTVFMYLDISEKGTYIISNNLKLIGVILCFLFSLKWYSKGTNRKDLYILRGALLFTVISDLFILIIDYYTLGILTFCIVQLLYLIRLCRWRNQLGIKRSLWKYLNRNLFAFGVLCILLSFKMELELLVVLSILYFVSIILNVCDSVWIAYKLKTRKVITFAFGMVLFLLCDINVLLFNLNGFVTINEVWFSRIYAFATIAMWMFYLPSQVVIALSGGKSIEQN